MNRHFSYLLETSLFATALYAVIDTVAMRLRIACAGHPRPVLLRTGQAASPLSVDGTFPLFMLNPTAVPISNHELHTGDRLLFYTDGITEHAATSGEMFGLERLMDSLARNAGRSPADLVQSVVEEVDAFAEDREPHDDQTILLAAVGTPG